MRWWKNAKEKYNIEIGGQKKYLISCNLLANINIKDDHVFIENILRPQVVLDLCFHII
jgi:hypothetical protein